MGLLGMDSNCSLSSRFGIVSNHFLKDFHLLGLLSFKLMQLLLIPQQVDFMHRFMLFPRLLQLVVGLFCQVLRILALSDQNVRRWYLLLINFLSRKLELYWRGRESLSLTDLAKILPQLCSLKY